MMVCPEGSVAVTGRGISPDDLLPLPSREDMATADALAALMRSRRSVRHFKDREVDAELLDRIVEMAASGPMGIPPWDVGCVVVRGRDEVEELAAELIQGYEGFLKIFRPWVLAVMRPFVGREHTNSFEISFARWPSVCSGPSRGWRRALLAGTSRPDIPSFALCGGRGCGDCLHLRHAGGGVAWFGQHDHRRRTTGSATQPTAVCATGHPRRPHTRPSL